ncbi:hydrolase [Virgisporangium aliadipatigenens]|uniref:Hydrolase n=1 Tax=Virgisporangium aliadipatigenens TaxID=741659 RepID=A0A8J3YKH0_9ACTN|nr:alpha/beta fold hydrolase [Virgisporangium aliadipatigenens]GIJ45488.1 hydrolase [Virgisporangium aliadipatigenens]
MSVNYSVVGAGEPLVLLHGLGHRWQAWEPVLDRLAAQHRVYAVDLPGFGLSPLPAGELPDGMPGVLEAVHAFLDALGLERPHVCGNSLGGAVALELAVTGRAASATALSPAGFCTEAEARRAVAILRRMRLSTLPPAAVLRLALAVPFVRAWSFGPLVTKPAALAGERALGDALALRNSTGFRAVARAAHHYRFAGAPSVPVTVAWGSADRILQPHQAERARELLPHARHVALPGCGHVPMSDAPDLVADLILSTTRTRHHSGS